MPETTVLQNCPFCGGPAEALNKKTYYIVRCKDIIGCRAAICYKTNTLYSAADVAVTCWNRRTNST